MKLAGLLRFLGVVAFGLALTGAAFVWTTPSLSPQVGRGSQGTVKVGAIYPLSTSIGKYAKAAIEVATDIINNPHPELGDLLLAKGGGLTGLGGAKIAVVFGDSNGEPLDGQKVASRLINDEKVVALNGAYHSRVTLTASAVAERLGIPFLNGDSVADVLTEHGFKWFFRTTPVAADFACMYTEFLKDMKAKGHTVDRIAIVHENTQYGVSVASVVTKTLKDNGLNITLDIPYSASKSDTSSEVSDAVKQLNATNPDVVMFISYTDDAIRFANMMESFNYKPRMMIADNAGFSDPAFIRGVGKIVQGVLIRSSWSAGAPGTPSYLVNEMYKNKLHVDLDNTTARIMQGFMVLADAINRAESTKPAKIQAALRATDLKPDQLIVRYNGVNFDDKGQNIKGSVLLTQLQDTEKDGLKYVPVWPREYRQGACPALPVQPTASAALLPYKGW
jgi:branched-chain amino acid transport system substrate-binding protein